MGRQNSRLRSTLKDQDHQVKSQHGWLRGGRFGTPIAHFFSGECVAAGGGEPCEALLPGGLYAWLLTPFIDPGCYNPPERPTLNFSGGSWTVIVNRSFDRWFIIFLPIGLFAVLSVHGVMRLKPDPPAQFLQIDPAWNAKRRAQEEEVARDYWKSATGAVQSEYGYGATLPQGPPEDFKIDAPSPNAGGLEKDPATRMRYWARFRQVWVLPETWEKTYTWDVGWVPRTLEGIRNWFVDSWERVFWKG